MQYDNIMIKLKTLMNEGDEPKKFSPEVKKHFLEIVSTYNKYQESLDRKSDILEIAETLGGIVDAAQELAVNESDDWFDKHTVKRNMGDLKKLGSNFDKVAVEAKSLDQRLNGLYEDMGHILSRYYKLGDISEGEMKARLGLNDKPVNEAKEFPSKEKLVAYMMKHGHNKKTSQGVVDANYEYVKKYYKGTGLPRISDVLWTVESVNDTNKAETWVLYGGPKRRPTVIEKFPNGYSANLAFKKNFGKKSSFDVYGIQPLNRFKQDYPQVKLPESVNEAYAHGAKYSKDGYVKKLSNQNGKLSKKVTVDGKEYKYNPVYKTYNSIKGNELLHKSDVEKAKGIIAEGVMSDIDVMAQESKDFATFTKSVFKEYKDLKKTRESINWLESLYKATNESVNEAPNRRISKTEIQLAMYKPRDDYFFEKIDNSSFRLHLSSRDAQHINTLEDKFNVTDDGRGHYGSAYIIKQKA